MNKATTILASIAIVLFSCSNNESRVTGQNTFGNGQPKTTIYKTIDDKVYYEIEYDSLGRIRGIIPYSNGQINGTKVYFHNLGVVVLLPFKNGKREGFTYEFYERQQTGFKGESKNGEFNGLSTWFHENGIPKESGIRTNGYNEGEWAEYYENGQIKAKGTYLKGTKQNDWTYWNNDGTTDTTQSN